LYTILFLVILRDHFSTINCENVIVNKDANTDKCHKNEIALSRKFVEEIKNN